MRHFHFQRLLPLALTGAIASAQNTIYVTDLQIFSLLAPCAASAVSDNIQGQTELDCGSAAPALQSCVCTKDNNLVAMSSSISSAVSWNCGSTATADFTSANAVLQQYCTPSPTITFATPTVSVDYITNIAGFSYLAPCAQSGVYEAVMDMTDEACPTPADLLASCVCSKPGVTLAVSQTINSSVRDWCSSNTADVASAQSLFSEFCQMANGTTNFPTPTNPPGDMTYYITALPQYSSLVPCAQSGVYYAVQYLTESLCPGGPQALASCACIKPDVSSEVTQTITSSVQVSCESTATEDINSALGVFSFYCAAARNEVKATGVSESIAQTYASAATGGSGPKATGSGGGSGSGGSGSGTNVATIVGGVVGAVGALVLVGILAFFLLKRKQLGNKPPAPAVAPPASDYGGKPELAGTAIYSGRPGSPNSGMGKNSSTSAVSALGSATQTPPPMPNSMYNKPPELPSQAYYAAPHAVTTPELQGQQAYAPQTQQQNLPPELQGQYTRPQGQQLPPELQAPYVPQGQYPPHGQYAPPAQPPAEAYGHQIHEFPAQNQVYEAGGQNVGPPRAQLQGMGWQSGPVPGYQEGGR